ncbi:MAG: GAF domain-containing protein, partial [Fimbriimonadales bacterium]
PAPLRVRPDETLVEPVLIERVPWHSVATTFEGRPLAPEIPVDSLQSIFAVPLPGVQMGALAVLNPSETAPEAVFAVLQQVAPTLGVLVTLQATQIQLQQRERALKWLRNLPTRLGDEICLPKVMEATERLLRKVSSVGGGLWLYDDDRTRLLCSVQYGTPQLPEQIDPSTLPSDWKASPVDISHDGRLFRLYPLNLAERTLGFIALAVVDDADAMDWVEPLTSPLALLLAHAWLYEQVARKAQNMTALYELSLKMGEVNTLREALHLLTETARAVVPHDYCVIYLPTRYRADFLTPELVSPPQEVLMRHAPHAQYSLPGWVYAFNAPIAAHDLANHPQNLKDPLPSGFSSALAVPIQVAERSLGVLLLLTVEPREFNLSEVELLFTLANTGALRLNSLLQTTRA